MVHIRGIVKPHSGILSRQDAGTVSREVGTRNIVGIDCRDSGLGTEHANVSNASIRAGDVRKELPFVLIQLKARPLQLQQ